MKMAQHQIALIKDEKLIFGSDGNLTSSSKSGLGRWVDWISPCANEMRRTVGTWIRNSFGKAMRLGMLCLSLLAFGCSTPRKYPGGQAGQDLKPSCYFLSMHASERGISSSEAFPQLQAELSRDFEEKLAVWAGSKMGGDGRTGELDECLQDLPKMSPDQRVAPKNWAPSREDGNRLFIWAEAEVDGDGLSGAKAIGVIGAVIAGGREMPEGVGHTGYIRLVWAIVRPGGKVGWVGTRQGGNMSRVKDRKAFVADVVDDIRQAIAGNSGKKI